MLPWPRLLAELERREADDETVAQAKERWFSELEQSEQWQALPEEVREGEALMMARWPEQDGALLFDEAEERMGLAMELVRGIRNRRAEYDVTPGKRIRLSLLLAMLLLGWKNSAPCSVRWLSWTLTS